MRVWLFGLILISAFSANAGDSIISTNLVKTPELTIENLKIILKQEKVKHADVVLQQAIVETGWFKCTHCSLSRNNIFGFYYKKKYLVFTDWVDCVRYYKRWQDRHFKGGDYYKFLEDVGYATNPKYVSDLKKIRL
ncbi:MAG: hypothetical protein HOL28_07520 [Crocinitomicaceae bacterium]|nr:hypothetical protein [Crocinitomicaceae bacterium]MBT5403278.1 hypothetical protein [Crocinitomicaceae bacterium]MBT6515030.1 hypothetical protein [Crocinitomicaceae bacterium]MDG2332462.1 glucosaminidase domain-containing protein [Flavobacteriales bacterium]